MFKANWQRIFAAMLALTLCAAQVTPAQTPPEMPTQEQADAEADEVVRISAELVQTDVSVFDKEGRFVEGLRQEDFEVYLDGRLQPLSFFESVVAGSGEEAAQLKAARSGSATAARQTAPRATSEDRGRLVFFFVDDLHLAPDSVARTRKSILHFVEEVMGPNDQAVVTSASSRIGFLQQLTSNKAVLRAAVERLKYIPLSVGDGDRPPMNEYLAYLIEGGDRDVIAAFVEQTVKDSGLNVRTAERLVRDRARVIMTQSDAVNRSLLASLQNVLRSAAQYPGRKLVYFVSDGFVLNRAGGGFGDRLRRVTDAAARAGVVIYAIGARGLSPASYFDASRPSFTDITGRVANALSREQTNTHEPLQTLAAATGGRALVNSNSLEAGIDRGLQETTRYYLLAWRPEGFNPRDKSFRKLQVKVAGRPELKVLVRGGYFGAPPAEPDKPKAAATPAAKPGDEMLSALTSLTAKRGLSAMLSLGYERAPSGAGLQLTASIQLDEEGLDYGTAEAPKEAVAEVAGAVFDDQGKSVQNFSQRLTIPPPAPGGAPRRIAFTRDFPLAPGIYQVRVAARDTRSGRLGSAMEWAEIPPFKPGGFLMSSLFLGERAQGAETGAGVVLVSVDRRFARTSRLRFLTHIYNAAHGPAPPDVTVKIEVLRDGQPVVNAPEQKVSTAKVANPASLPYAAEIGLGSLPAGRYVLQVTATDRTAKTSSTQRADFSVL